MITLKEHLEDWVDFDWAEFSWGVVLGLWPDTQAAFQENKWVFWTTNPLGDMLHSIMKQMVQVGTIEKNDDGYRWKKEMEQ